MGDPKKPKKKYRTPSMPWKKERIDTENALLKEYGLRNKTEIWRTGSLLNRFKTQAKKCATARTEQLQKERQQLLKKLQKMGLIGAKGSMDDVLSLTVEDLLNNRLQTMVFKKGLASTAKQARQLIIHGLVTVGSKKVTVPSYMVKADEQGHIALTKEISIQQEKKNG